MHMSNVRWAASSCVVYRECVFVCVCVREREVNSFRVDQVLLIQVLTQCWDY